MEILDILELIKNPIAWIPTFVIASFLVTIVGLGLDELSTWLSNGLTWIRKEFIKKIPFSPLRKWLLQQQLKSVEATIKIWQKALADIKFALK